MEDDIDTILILGESGAGKNHYAHQHYSRYFDLDLAGAKILDKWTVDPSKIDTSYSVFIGTFVNLEKVMMKVKPDLILFLWPPYELWAKNQFLKRKANPTAPPNWWADRSYANFQYQNRRRLAEVKLLARHIPIKIIFTKMGQHSGEAWFQNGLRK